MAQQFAAWAPVSGYRDRFEDEDAGILPLVVRLQGSGLSGRDTARRVHRPFSGRIHRIGTWEGAPDSLEAANIAAGFSRVND